MSKTHDTMICRLAPEIRVAHMKVLRVDRTVTVDMNIHRTLGRDGLRSFTGTLLGVGHVLWGVSTDALVLRVGDELQVLQGAKMVRVRVGNDVLWGAPL